MEFIYGLLSGSIGSFFLAVRVHRRMCARIIHNHYLDDQAKVNQTIRDTIESGRDTDPRRGDYAVAETDLFGTVPGAMTKDHLQHMRRIPVKSVDLYPDWTRMEESGSEGDQVQDQSER